MEASCATVKRDIERSNGLRSLEVARDCSGEVGPGTGRLATMRESCDGKVDVEPGGRSTVGEKPEYTASVFQWHDEFSIICLPADKGQVGKGIAEFEEQLLQREDEQEHT